MIQKSLNAILLNWQKIIISAHYLILSLQVRIPHDDKQVSSSSLYSTLSLMHVLLAYVSKAKGNVHEDKYIFIFAEG